MTDTKPTTTVNKWQAKINREFPNGLLMMWKGSEESESAPVYRIFKANVLDVEGFDPIVELKVFDIPKRFVGRVVSYETIQDNPLMVEVKFEDIDTPMIWSANISDTLAALMKSGPIKI